MNPIRRFAEFLIKDEERCPWLYPIMPFFAGLVLTAGSIMFFWQFWPGIGAFVATLIAMSLLGVVIGIFGHQPHKE